MTDETETPEPLPSKAAGGLLADDFAVETFDDLAHLPADDLRIKVNTMLHGPRRLMMGLSRADLAIRTAFLGAMDEDTAQRMAEEMKVSMRSDTVRGVMEAKWHVCHLANLHLEGHFDDFGELAALSEADWKTLIDTVDDGVRRIAAALQGADEVVRAAFHGVMTADEIELVAEQAQAVGTFSDDEVAVARESIRLMVESSAVRAKERAAEGSAVLAKEWQATLTEESEAT